MVTYRNCMHGFVVSVGVPWMCVLAGTLKAHDNAALCRHNSPTMATAVAPLNYNSAFSQKSRSLTLRWIDVGGPADTRYPLPVKRSEITACASYGCAAVSECGYVVDQLMCSDSGNSSKPPNTTWKRISRHLQRGWEFGSSLAPAECPSAVSQSIQRMYFVGLVEGISSVEVPAWWKRAVLETGQRKATFWKPNLNAPWRKVWRHVDMVARDVTVWSDGGEKTLAEFDWILTYLPHGNLNVPVLSRNICEALNEPHFSNNYFVIRGSNAAGIALLSSAGAQVEIVRYARNGEKILWRRKVLASRYSYGNGGLAGQEPLVFFDCVVDAKKQIWVFDVRDDGQFGIEVFSESGKRRLSYSPTYAEYSAEIKDSNRGVENSKKKSKEIKNSKPKEDSSSDSSNKGNDFDRADDQE